jgi:hypothetical protein
MVTSPEVEETLRIHPSPRAVMARAAAEERSRTALRRRRRPRRRAHRGPARTDRHAGQQRRLLGQAHLRSAPRATRTRLNPRRASASANADPMPEVPPVIRADLSDADDVARVAERIEDPRAPIDMLVNNAGFSVLNPRRASASANADPMPEVPPVIRAVIMVDRLHYGTRSRSRPSRPISATPTTSPASPSASRTRAHRSTCWSTTRLNPRRASASANADPMPEVPPVIRAVIMVDRLGEGSALAPEELPHGEVRGQDPLLPGGAVEPAGTVLGQVSERGLGCG